MLFYFLVLGEAEPLCTVASNGLLYQPLMVDEYAELMKK
jgi:hypothetical protein